VTTKINFFREGDKKIVSYRKIVNFKGFFTFFVILGILLIIFYQDKSKIGGIIILAFLIIFSSILFIPREIILESNKNSKFKLICEERKPILNIYRRYYTEDYLQRKKWYQKIGFFPYSTINTAYLWRFAFLFKTISKEQAKEINKFLELKENLGVPFF